MTNLYDDNVSFEFASNLVEKIYGEKWKDEVRYWEVVTDRLTKKGNTIVYLYVVCVHSSMNDVPDLKGRFFGIRLKSKSTGNMYNTYLFNKNKYLPKD